MSDMNQNEPQVDFESISILIPKSKNGDQNARASLLREMQAYLEMTARKHMDTTLKQKIGPSDIVQQSFLRVIENFENFRGGSANEFRGWLKAIVINEMHNIRRSFRTGKRDVTREKSVDANNSTAPGFTPADSNLTPSSEAVASERIEHFHEILEQLSDEYAAVIRYRIIDRLQFKEIAERMDRSEDAVSKLWYRAMLKFEEKLKNSGNFES